MTFSNFAITGYYDPASPPALSGNISGFLYWHEGLANWVELTDTPPTVPQGTAFHLAVGWLNQSVEAMSGHIELTITKPDGTEVTLNDVLNQNNWAAPGNGWYVQFEPIILDQGGDYQAEAVLSSIGQVLDQRSVPLVSVQAAAKFYMPPKFTKAKIVDRWTMPPYYFVMEFECPITNNGGTAGTQTILVGNDHPDELEPWSFTLTLQPGETYLWKHTQLAIWPMTFYLQGDWQGNNYSEGTASW